MLCIWRFTSILGTVVVLILMSVNDRLERKKYMGVWRWESEMTARMMSRFPRTVTRYMDRNRLNKMVFRFSFSVSLMRRNSETAVWFLGSMMLMNLMNKVW